MQTSLKGSKTTVLSYKLECPVIKCLNSNNKSIVNSKPCSKNPSIDQSKHCGAGEMQNSITWIEVSRRADFICVQIFSWSSCLGRTNGSLCGIICKSLCMGFLQKRRESLLTFAQHNKKYVALHHKQQRHQQLPQMLNTKIK